MDKNHLSCQTIKTEDLLDWRFLEAAQLEVSTEILRATRKFGKFNSAHEGYAVLLEEVEELWDEIKDKKRSQYKMKTEAIQVAAMAIRIILDCFPILDKDGLTDTEEYPYDISHTTIIDEPIEKMSKCPQCGAMHNFGSKYGGCCGQVCDSIMRDEC